MTTVGFIGLGSMGLPMATNLAARGFAVRGFDIRPAAMNTLVEAGGTRASAAAHAADGADVLILMVVNAAQAEAVLFEGGALAALPKNGIVVARAATLTVIAAAPRATFETAKPVLEALGDKIFHVGERPGQGAMVKAVNQLLCGVHTAVAAEAFSLAAKADLDLSILLD